MATKQMILFISMGLCFTLTRCHRNDQQNPQVNVTPSIPTTGYSTPDHYDGMTLIWQDEFNGTSLNTADWNYETGGGGWGNHELENYQSSNTSVSDGYLIIQAREETAGTYTSSRINTQNKQTFQYGRVDMRAALPKGQGIWPALWMLGASISTVGWPTCGEIDIMEMVGGNAPGGDSTVHGTTHWDNNGNQTDGGEKSLTGKKIFANDFHVFSIIWNASSITYYLDDVAYHTTNTISTGSNAFNAPFFIIFNVAIGGDWPGDPSTATTFPQQMVVDYVRVFQ